MNDTPSANGEAVGISDLLEAESILTTLSEQMAAEYQQAGKEWKRDWMQKHVNDRAAIMAARRVLLDRIQASNAEVSGSESAAPTVRTTTATKP
jgi:hypothetical protein